MGLALDPKTGYIYSCGSDKKFVYSEINFQESISGKFWYLYLEITTGTHGFTNLVYDKKNERIFLTNEIGIFYAYSTTTVIKLNKLSLESSNSLDNCFNFI